MKILDKENLFAHVSNYKRNDIYPFHMPGHKGNKNFLDFDFLSLDVTEFGQMDNLHNPKGFILDSQKMVAKLFGAEESFYLVNGSSAGLIAAILTVCSVGDSILVSRNCHVSVYNGILLSGANPIYLYPKITSGGLVGGIDKVSVEEAILKNNTIKAVIITSPTYEGFCSDTKSIAKITNKYNKVLIIDEAHGAHFNFSDFFPDSSAKYADVVIQSLHKTLPTLSQSAIIHVNGKRIDRKKLFKKISLMQTTSPSYILMAIMDYCINTYANKASFREIENLLKKYRGKFKNTNSIKLINDDIIGDSSIYDIDKSKLVFAILDDKITGYDLEKILVEKYKIQVELSGYKHIVALTSICDTEYGFKKLNCAIKEIDKTFSCNNYIVYLKLPKAFVVYSPYDVESKIKKFTNIEQTLGKVSGEFIIPYPPGIPILVPGELISKEIYDYIDFLKKNKVKVIGCNDPNLNFLETL